MSVLIKGMEMPTRCEDCPVCHYMERGTITICGCKATMKIRPIDCNSKPYWCPLVGIPAPHGRLIDADEFLKRAIGTKCFDEDYARMLQELVGESTTIIPAEEGDSDDV